MSAGERVFLDACCLINLFATDRIEEIFGDLPYRFAVSEYVARNEVIRIDSSAPTTEARTLAFERLSEAGLLAVIPTETEEELAMQIRFAALLDDGEASVCALACCRGGRVATDDRKALRILDQLAPEVPVLQTPELLFEWAQMAQRTDHEIRAALTAVRVHARFLPAVSAPHSDWWHGILSS